MQGHSLFSKSILLGGLASILLFFSCGKSQRLHGEWAVRDIYHNEYKSDSAKLADCQTSIVGFSFFNDGKGQLTNNRGRLFDMTWSYQDDKLTMVSEALGREQTVAITWDGKNTLFIDNCLRTYEFNRQ